jgi:2-methylcitrate dehydratase PrpD/AraC-like DNA-binding protein
MTRSAVLTGFADLVRSRGLDPIRLAAKAGIPPHALTHTDLNISAAAADRLLALAGEETGIEDFGLRLAEMRRLSNLGLVGLLAREQGTVRQVVEVLSKYIWLHHEASFVLFEETSDVAIIRVEVTAGGKLASRHTTELAVGALCLYLRGLMRRQWRPQAVMLQHDSPADPAAYRKVFGALPAFGARCNAIMLAPADLDEPIESADPVMAAHIGRYVEGLARTRQMDFRSTITQLITTLLPTQTCTIERVAAYVGTTRRTLSRRLAAEGCTFTQLVDGTRRRLVLGLIAESRPCGEIAGRAGFASASGFSHWFHREFGKSPRHYRDESGAAPLAPRERESSLERRGAAPAIGRRALLGLSGAAAATLAAARPGWAAPLADTAPPKVTQILARYIVEARFEDLPARVRHEGARSLLNWAGVAIGGSRHRAVEIAVAALAPFSGPPQASLLGRRERFDAMNAAFVNGVSSHVFDYDDTHLKTIIHPAGPVASAILAYAEMRRVSGRDFLNALVLGIETECRIGNAVYPDHYDAGWHITGTAGAFGAAAAVAKLMRLDVEKTVWALGLAASQPVGLKDSFGSMNKSFNPGRAAANGLFAAILAEQGFTSSNGMIEDKGGWANAVSTKRDYREILDGLGTRYEAALNTYKPFACGIVLHPAIDAALQLRAEHGLAPDAIERIELRVNPLVLELTGKTAPATGLEGKFSVYHAVAVAIAEGAGGERQFSDRAVRDPAVVALRARVKPVIDAAIKPEQVEMSIVLKDGRRLTRHIDHAVGSLESPMSDAALEGKFTDLAEGILPGDRIRKAMDLCWNVETLGDAGEIARSCAD